MTIKTSKNNKNTDTNTEKENTDRKTIRSEICIVWNGETTIEVGLMYVPNIFRLVKTYPIFYEEDNKLILITAFVTETKEKTKKLIETIGNYQLERERYSEEIIEHIHLRKNMFVMWEKNEYPSFVVVKTVFECSAQPLIGYEVSYDGKGTVRIGFSMHFKDEEETREFIEVNTRTARTNSTYK